MNDSAMAKRLVDAVISDFPDYVPGTRPVHSIGVGVNGYFVASDVARTFCIAEHFQGQRIAASMRFSNGSGGPDLHDSWSDIRGMATRFHLTQGPPTDLIAQTLSEFFAPTLETFMEFSEAARPKPVRRQSPWSKMLDLMQLRAPLPDPMPGQTSGREAGALAYADRHRFAQLSVLQAGPIGAPVSYARASYHAVHTFVVTAPDGERRHVRFSWEPVAGVRLVDPKSAPVDDYLRAELETRLRRWPAAFLLMMTIGEAGDAFDDPTRPWPVKRVRVVMGSLTLTGLAKDQAAAAERISFNPCRLTSGIEASCDPILRARRDAYEVSREMRGGDACPFSGS